MQSLYEWLCANKLALNDQKQNNLRVPHTRYHTANLGIHMCNVQGLRTITTTHNNICNELGGNMARFTQFPIMITRSTIIYDIISPGAAGSSIYV